LVISIRLIGWLWLLAAFLICVPSTGQELGSDARTAFRVEYVGPEGCSSANALTQKIAGRAPHARAASPSEEAVTFQVELETHAGVSGRLLMREADGRTTIREVHAANCREATAALTLIAAVLLDPLGVVEDLPPREMPRLLPSAPTTRLRSPPAAPRAVAGWSFGAAAGIGFEGAATPTFALAESLEVNALQRRGSGFEPMLALSLNRTSPEDVRVAAGDSRFSWISARLAACPLALVLLEPLSLRVCGLFDAGELHASADSPQGARVQVMPWFALGAEIRLEWSLVRPLLLSLEGGVISPLSRGRFFFEPDDSRNTAFVVPAVGGVARFGFGLRF
jgi:hypothetical protein